MLTVVTKAQESLWTGQSQWKWAHFGAGPLRAKWVYGPVAQTQAADEH